MLTRYRKFRLALVNIFILCPVRRIVQQRYTRIIKRKTHLILNNAMNTTAERSVAQALSQALSFELYSPTRFQVHKGDNNPQPSPHQSMGMILAFNQQ